MKTTLALNLFRVWGNYYAAIENYAFKEFGNPSVELYTNYTYAHKRSKGHFSKS